MKLFGTFTKVEEQDDGTLIVSGTASSETEDAQGEVVKASAIIDASPEYMKFGAVREMHQSTAAGTALDLTVDDTTGKTDFTAHVVDPIAVKKVQTGVYKGFSIGGKVTKRDPDNKKIITGLKLTEISLVDRPANPDATFSLFKADVAAEGEETVEKSMNTVSTLAGVLQSITYLAQDAEWEKQWEGDNSEAPAKIRAWLKDGAGILGEVVAEETAELISATEGVVKADVPGDVAKEEIVDDLAKAGARNSKADQDKIQAVHDHAMALGASCDGAKKADAATGDDVLAKVTSLTDDLAKATTARDEALQKVTTLEKRVQELEAEPAAPKGVLKAVAKGEDVIDVAKADETTITDADDPLTAMKKVHRAGGTMIKL